MVRSRLNSTYIPKAEEFELIYLPVIEEEQRETEKVELVSSPNLTCWPLSLLSLYKGKILGPRLIWCRFTALHQPVPGIGQEPHLLCVRIRPLRAAVAKESLGCSKAALPWVPPTAQGPSANIVFLDRVAGWGNWCKETSHVNALHICICSYIKPL